MNADERHNAYLRAAYERSIDSITADLRRLADDVERNKTPRGIGRVARPYLSAAEDVVQSIVNCLPNLNLGLLIERAHDCETLMDSGLGTEGEQE